MNVAALTLYIIWIIIGHTRSYFYAIVKQPRFRCRISFFNSFSFVKDVSCERGLLEAYNNNIIVITTINNYNINVEVWRANCHITINSMA